ncbi:MAG: acyl-CoA dehydrogenase C-terminal domain-containing protein [Desulfobacterales bacterium]|nr:acyl-CoA dehydrogenase C-terminal domain-containing protein [Desulfobacterales bacterium]
MSQKPVTFSIDSRDIRFALFDLFRIQDLLKFERFQHLGLDQMEMLLAQAERMAIEVLSPLNKVADQTHPQYRDGKVTMPPAFHSAFRKYAGARWIPSTLDKEGGGLGLPESLGMAITEIFNGACGGFYAFSSLSSSALHLIGTFGTEAIKRRFLDKIVKGTFTGTMCLTEPGAGSYLADITTRATRDGETFKIKGTKIFIGTGDHDLSENIVHCVLARIEGAPSGYKGISLFIVPKYRVNEDGTLGPLNDVHCSGIESKMGWDGAPTATLHFGDHDECQGWLLGEEGQGLALMFHMMNEMRLATGAQGVGQAAAAYRIALSFARERIQGLSYRRQKGDPPVQVPIIDHPDIRRNLLFMKSVVEGCRRLIIQTALYIDLSKAVDDEREREHYQDLVEILTPICKAYATDMGFRVAETAVQSMGGYGYVKDYHVEQYLRDLKVSCIYEGTSGIHAIDLQRRKLNIKGGQLFGNLIQEMDGFIQQNLRHSVLGPSIGKLEKAKEKMVEVAKSFSIKRQEDPGLPLSVAKPFLDLTGHIVSTWMLLKSAVVADSLLGGSQTSEMDRAFYQGKIFTARFAVSNLLPQVDALAQTISAWDRSILDMGEAAF